ncbi:MAG TPA: hypothetical protein VFH22_15060, partial [Rhodocyclaceae bacterium]|nr:hypothetical protein [Rhodocyclaceae bacterium]
MKIVPFTLSLLLTSSVFAQTFQHPPVGGHPVPAADAAGATGTGNATPQYQLPAELFRTPANPRGAPRGAALPNVGTVISAQQSGGYSYIEVSGPQGNTWLAAPVAPLNVGDKIRYEDGATMHNFTSKALGRTFPSIIFVGSVSPAGSEDVAPAEPAQPLIEGVVISSQDAGGYSYIEVKTEAGNTWLAGPATPLKAGDK